MKGLPVFAIKDCFCIICENIQKRIPVRCQFRDWAARIVRGQKWLTATIFILVLIPSVFGNQITDSNEVLSPYKLPEILYDQYVALVHRIRLPEIPESNLYRLGITIDESILDNPEMATRKTSRFGSGFFTGKQWIGGGSSFNASFLVDKKKSIIAGSLDFLAGVLQINHESQKKISLGQLDIGIVNAPSAKAAFDCLLYDASMSNMPIEAIAWGFAEKLRIHDLGTLSYNQGNRIYFIRDNIAVVISSHGEFEDQVEDIARKIDAKLLQQPLLTYEQLQARRPTLHIGPGRKTTPRQTPFLEYSVEAPAGVQAFASDLKINGRNRSRQDYKIYLEEKPKTVKVEAVLVTNELLAFPFETEIEMPDENEVSKQE